MCRVFYLTLTNGFFLILRVFDVFKILANVY